MRQFNEQIQVRYGRPLDAVILPEKSCSIPLGSTTPLPDLLKHWDFSEGFPNFSERFGNVIGLLAERRRMAACASFLCSAALV
jgi:hypothetical protein